MSGTGDYWVVAQVVAPEVGHVQVKTPSGDQAVGPRLGGGTRAPITADGDGSMAAYGLGGGQVAGNPGVCCLDQGGTVPDSLTIL